MSSIIVRDEGFVPDEWRGEKADSVIISIADISDQGMPGDNRIYGLDVPNNVQPDAVVKLFDYVKLIRVSFPSFADGRGFSIARKLRELGFEGTLRAHGHVIADQYVHARRCGFDEIEISEELAGRQPESEWKTQADLGAITYQERLKVWQR